MYTDPTLGAWPPEWLTRTAEKVQKAVTKISTAAQKVQAVTGGVKVTPQTVSYVPAVPRADTWTVSEPSAVSFVPKLAFSLGAVALGVFLFRRARR